MYYHLRGLSLESVLRELDSEIVRRKEIEKIAFFDPNGPQEKFINLVGDGDRMVGILSAANSVGKTALVANIFGNLLFGSQTPFFDKPIFLDWPYPKRARYITNPKMVEEIGPFHTEILKWWPKGKYEAIKAGKNHYSQYKANDWVVDVMTYDQAPKEFEGGTLGLIIMDEPPPRHVWNACISRLRLGGLILLFLTPLSDAAWLFDEVIPRHQESVVYADIEENCKQHGIRGQLEHAQIERMIAEMDPEEVEARAHGKAMYLKGLIFKTFDYHVHVAKEKLSVPTDAQIWQIVDPHVDKPFASIWGYPGRDGRFIQVDEWPNEDFYSMRGCDLGIQDYVRIFKTKEHGWRVKKRIIDRHFGDVRSLQTKRTLREDFARLGYHYEPSYQADEEVETGIFKVRSYLHYNTKKPIDSLNQPRYLVSPHCTNTIKGFQRWSFDMKNGRPKDEYKDFMDCVRYGLMSDPKVSEMPPAKEARKLYG